MQGDDHPPHPEEAPIAGVACVNLATCAVSKDGAAPCFETRYSRTLLSMRPREASSRHTRAVFWWRGPMIAAGFAFGVRRRRPFGETFLGHPIALFPGIAGLGLLILRVGLRRPVPEMIPERAIVLGSCWALPRFWSAIGSACISLSGVESGGVDHVALTWCLQVALARHEAVPESASSRRCD